MPERRFIVFHVEMLFRNGHLSYWGISAVAETTRVDPRMFDCVCGHVHLQACWIYVSFVAIGALVGLVLIVLTSVGLKKKKVIESKGFTSVLWDRHCMHSLYENETKLFHTCKLESCVKDFSQPGWIHLYGRSPVWILNKIHKQTHTCTYNDSCYVHDELTWPQKDTRAEEKPKTDDSLTCCAAEGDWAVWSTFGSSCRCRVSLRCGCEYVGPNS